jgi:hypothetical protein
MLIRKIIGIDKTLEGLLREELLLVNGFLNAIEILKKEKIDCLEDIEEEKLLGLMIKEAMKETKGSINPRCVIEKAKEYLRVV